MLVAQFGRLGLMGKAHKEVGGKHEAMGWRQVLREWRVGSVQEEALMRRLRWYQAMSRYPEESVQPMAALFSQCKCESHPPLDEAGRLTPYANPWAV
eukprot:122015-Lingulodinium_polyedra.AAC.1